MGKSEHGGLARVAAFCGRHPLFMAALAATACVLAADRSPWLAGATGLLIAAAGVRLAGWKTGLAWLACGSLATVVFIARNHSQRTDERVLLAFPG